jgi:predicted metal-dependent phosphoesterase TrpH
VQKKNFTPEEAITLIHKAGGIVILAHPAIDETYRHLELLVGLGLDGIEVFHPAHKQKHIDQFKHMAERYRLTISGGSDYHGREGNYGDVGSQHVPEECLEAFRHRAQQRKANL